MTLIKSISGIRGTIPQIVQLAPKYNSDGTFLYSRSGRDNMIRIAFPGVYWPPDTTRPDHSCTPAIRATTLFALLSLVFMKSITPQSQLAVEQI